MAKYNLEYKGVTCTAANWEADPYKFVLIYKGCPYVYEQKRYISQSADTDHIRCVIEQFLEDVEKDNNGWISVAERLPDEGEYVMIFCGSIQIARIIKGISEEDRERMRNGEIKDPLEMHWNGSEGYHFVPRSRLYKVGDVLGNNIVPYSWEANGGPMKWFGQEVTHWQPLPEPPKESEGKE